MNAPTRPIRLAANLSTMFQEIPFEARAQEAAACGFRGLEVQFPYDHSSAEWRAMVRPSGLPVVLLNAPKGSGGEPGIASLPDRQDEFRESLNLAAEYVSALGCPLVHVLAGTGGDRSCYLQNLALAIDVLAPAGAEVVVEVLNQIDVPGYHLRSIADARQVMASVPGLGLQYDIYHAARAGEDIAATLARLGHPPRHLQVSSCPGRHEPDDATMVGLGQAIEGGYGGFVGCEYWPLSTTRAGLGWAAAFGVG